MISLIVPVYNAEKEIKSCVQSLREQSYTSIEILLINDGSTDKTGEICDAWLKQIQESGLFIQKTMDKVKREI